MWTWASKNWIWCSLRPRYESVGEKRSFKLLAFKELFLDNPPRIHSNEKVHKFVSQPTFASLTNFSFFPKRFEWGLWNCCLSAVYCTSYICNRISLQILDSKGIKRIISLQGSNLWNSVPILFRLTWAIMSISFRIVFEDHFPSSYIE